MLTSVRVMCFVQLVALTATQAQTSPSRPTSAVMPQAHMQGSDNLKRTIVTGVECMQKAPQADDTESQFKTMMYEYHRQGVEMAQTQRVNGKSGAIKVRVKKIISANEKEIAPSNQRLDNQK